MVHHRTGVVVVDDVRLLDGRTVTATVAIDDGTALDLEIGLVQLREMEAHITLGGLQLCNRILTILVLLVIDGVYHLAWIRAWCLLIIIVTVTAGKELSDIHLPGIRVWLDVICCLAVSFSLRVISRRSNLSSRIMLISYLRADTHIAVKGVIDGIALWVDGIFWMVLALDGCQLRRILSHSCCRTDISGDVIAAKHLVDQDIVRRFCSQVGLTVDMDKGVAAHIGHTGAAEHLTLRIFQRADCSRVENGADIAGFHGHFR